MTKICNPSLLYTDHFVFNTFLDKIPSGWAFFLVKQETPNLEGSEAFCQKPRR
jgi:hypothetical protein